MDFPGRVPVVTWQDQIQANWYFAQIVCVRPTGIPSLKMRRLRTGKSRDDTSEMAETTIIRFEQVLRIFN